MPARVIGRLVKAATKKAPSAKAKRAAEAKARKEFGMPKGVTTGKAKAVRKVQKGIDKTDARIPNSPRLRAEIKNNKIYAADEYGSYRQRGSNRKAAKGTGPKRTPGVKKNKSLQRSINKSNRELMR